MAYGTDSEKHHMDTLKDHIIKGLINTVVKRQIRKRETATAELLRQALIEPVRDSASWMEALRAPHWMG